MSKLKALLLTEGMHGMISQVEGLAKALDTDFTHQQVELKSFWKFIPPRFTPKTNISFKSFLIPDVDLIISCGRKSVIPSIFLKKNSKKKIYNIHVQDPKVDFKNFDFVIVPEHDSVIGSNVIQTKGAIHYLTNAEIDKNSEYLKSIIKKDERKVISLIMGGPTKYYDYSKQNINKIFNDLDAIIKKENFQLVIIPSMRTPKNIIQSAKDFFGEKHTVIEDIDKKAYLSALAISEFLFVTCDSSSMISEAALTGKPIYIANISAKKNDKRFKKFRSLFKELNIIKNLGEPLEKWSYQKLDETNRVAKIIKERINI